MAAIALTRGQGAAAVILSALLVATACGPDDHDSAEPAAALSDSTSHVITEGLPVDPPPGTPRIWAREMRKWKRFPVQAEPRPIVLTGAVAHRANDYTRPESLAFADPSELPSGPANAGGYPLIDAGEALDVLHSLAVEHPRTRRHVVLTGIKLGNGTFWTDRGLQQLPAWRVTYKTPHARRSTTVAVLAIQPQEWFRGTADNTAVGVSPDDRALLVAHHSSTCVEGFLVDTFETRTSVAYRISHIASMGPNECIPRPETSILRVPLARPLGNRIVLQADPNGPDPTTYPALPCGTRDWSRVDVPPCTPTKPAGPRPTSTPLP